MYTLRSSIDAVERDLRSPAQVMNALVMTRVVNPNHFTLSGHAHIQWERDLLSPARVMNALVIQSSKPLLRILVKCNNDKQTKMDPIFCLRTTKK